MGAVDRIQTIFARPRQAALQTGTAAPITDVLDVITPNQDRARDYSGRIPMVADVVSTSAMLGASCPLRVEYLQNDGSWRPADDATERDFIAEHALSMYRPQSGTQAHLVERELRLRFRVGEAWRVQVPDPADPNARGPVQSWTMPYRWALVDPRAKQRKNRSEFVIYRQPGGSVSLGTAWLVDKSRVQRIWSPDDTYEMHATSPMFGVLDDCAALLKGGRNVNRRLDSRTVGGKILHLPKEAATQLPPEQIRPGGPQTDIEQAYQSWAASNASSLSDNKVAAVAPFLLFYADQYREPKLIDLGDQLDQYWLPYRQELLNSIAQGMPFPTNLVLSGAGAGGNHWGDWLADDKATQRIRYDLSAVCEGVTAGVFRPMLRFWESEGLYPSDPDRVRVGFDASPLTMNPDITPLLLDLLKLGVVGPMPLMREAGLSDEDLATEKERADLLEFAARGRVIETPAGVMTAPQNLPNEPVQAQTQVKAAALAPIVVSSPVIDDAAAMRIAEAIAKQAPKLAAAAVPDPVSPAAANTSIDWAKFSTAMNAEDRRFRDVLAAICSTSMTEALRLAGVKVAAKGNNKPKAVKEMIHAAAASGWFPEPVLAAAGVTTNEALGGKFDSATATAVAALAAHQAKRRQIVAQALPETDFEAWDDAETERRNALAVWLPSALFAVAVGKLTSANVAPAQGEVPLDPSVPGNVVAAVMRVSNGADVRDGTVEAPTREAAVGMVDPLIADAAATAGALPLYSWVHGDAAVPFDPHLNLELDGVTWDDDTMAEVLRNDEDFPDTDVYYPGDHLGCSCGEPEVVWSEGMAGDFGVGDIIGDLGEGDGA